MSERFNLSVLEGKLFVNKKQVAEFLGCSERTVDRKEDKGEIAPSFYDSGRKLWDVEKFISYYRKRYAMQAKI